MTLYRSTDRGRVPMTEEEEAAFEASRTPTPTDVQAAAAIAVQSLLDSTAQAHGYDSILSVISYRDSVNPTWKGEAEAFYAWRDACWAKSLEIQGAVMAGDRPLPTVVEVVAEMPVLGV